jgi:multiple sugar transport system substrate-binding protein
MKQLQFSVAQPEHLPEVVAFFRKLAEPTLEPLDFQLAVEGIPLEKLWYFVQTKSISRSGLNVSEVGSTWIGSLADADALRPFSGSDVEQLGGMTSFIETSWSGATLVNDERVLSIPWLADTRVIYYWRDVLEDAGIDEETAFESAEKTRETMERLRASGKSGWGAPTFGCNNNVHHVAPWIWAKGADFVSSDGSRTTFCDHEALEGILEYFQLSQYMPRAFDSLTEIIRAFESKQVAAIIDGPWLWTQILMNRTRTIDVANVGITPPPGPPFVGGSNLIIWQHCPDDYLDVSMTLIERLTSTEVQATLAKATGLLPVRKALFEKAPYTVDANYHIFKIALEEGRHLPRIVLWGPIEISLVQTFGVVWESIKDSGFRRVNDLLRRHLEPLARRFDKMLELF